MKKLLTLVVGLSVLSAMSASAQSIFNGYAYVGSNTTAGVDTTWYDLSGAAQTKVFKDSDLGDFESNLWLGGQTGFWSDSQGVEYITMHYSISGEATASGTISYAYESYSAPDDQWGTDINGANLSDQSIDLITTHSLGVGDYNLAVWVEGKAKNKASVYDSNDGANYNATFAVIDSGTTSSGVDVRAYQAADGVYVEFVANDVEADGSIQLALLNEAGEPVWTGEVDVEAGPQFAARFKVPGLELYGTYDFLVRDEVGKWWDADGVTVGGFSAEVVSASLAGITLSFDSLPEHTYEIQWSAELGKPWQTVDEVTATGEQTEVVVPHPDPENASGFFRFMLK